MKDKTPWKKLLQYSDYHRELVFSNLSCFENVNEQVLPEANIRKSRSNSSTKKKKERKEKRNTKTEANVSECYTHVHTHIQS